MKKLLLTIFLFIFFINCYHAQRLAPGVFSSGSVNFKKQGVVFSGTIGQLMAPTLKNKNFLTPGFEQSKIVFKKTNLVDIQNNAFIVYPNPVSGILYVTLKSSNAYEIDRIEIYNLIGQAKNIDSQRFKSFQNQNIEIDMSIFLPGQYFIRLVPKNNSGKVLSFKVIKN